MNESERALLLAIAEAVRMDCSICGGAGTFSTHDYTTKPEMTVHPCHRCTPLIAAIGKVNGG